MAMETDDGDGDGALHSPSPNDEDLFATGAEVRD